MSTLLDIATCYTSQEDLSTAKAAFLQGLALAEELGDLYYQTYAHNGLGDLFCAQGDYKSALAAFERGLALSQQLGMSTGVLLLNANTARLFMGEFGAAQEAFADIREAIGASTRRDLACLLCMQELVCDARAQDWTAWDERYEEVQGFFQARNHPEREVTRLLLLCGKILAPNDHARACKVVRLALELLANVNRPRETQEAQQQLAALELTHPTS